MSKNVAVVAVGHAKFGKRNDVTLREIAFEAVKPAFEEAGIRPNDVDATVVGVAGEEFAAQGAPAALISDYVGTLGKPLFRVEAACATGSAAIRSGWSLIASGLAETVLVVGAETMTWVSSSRATELMARAGDTRWEYPLGVSFPAFYALMASAHMAEYGTTREQLSMVSVKNHKYGALNPYAHLQKEVTLEEAMNSHMICHPLNLFDCCLITDGAAAVILASDDRAGQLTDTPVWVRGLGAASDTMLINERQDLTSLSGTPLAAAQALKMANVSMNDIDVCEAHDCFSIAEIIAYEDLGICKKGEGGKFIEQGQSYIGGQMPTNVDGGLKAKGHPIGATGVSMAVEITKQLRGEAGKRQVNGAELGLAHNVGQTGQFVYVTVFSR